MELSLPSKPGLDKIMHKAAAITGKTIIVLLIAVAILTATLIGYARWQGIRILSIQSDSMQPAIDIGDVVLVRQFDNRGMGDKATHSELRVGDVVTFNSPTHPAMSITHRIVSYDSSRNTIVTKGDSSPLPDTAMSRSAIDGKVFKIIAHGGTIFDFFRSPIGLILAVYVPAVVLTAGEVRRLMRYYASQRYKLYRRMY